MTFCLVRCGRVANNSRPFVSYARFCPPESQNLIAAEKIAASTQISVRYSADLRHVYSRQREDVTNVHSITDFCVPRVFIDVHIIHQLLFGWPAGCQLDTPTLHLKLAFCSQCRKTRNEGSASDDDVDRGPVMSKPRPRAMPSSCMRGDKPRPTITHSPLTVGRTSNTYLKGSRQKITRPGNSSFVFRRMQTFSTPGALQFPVHCSRMELSTH